MKRGNLLLTFLATVLITSLSFAQGSITGTVLDASYGESLIGATVLVKGTTTGTTTDINGHFLLELSAGSYTIEFSYIGYETQDIDVSIKDGQSVRMNKVKLTPASTLLEGVNIIADRAKERETPVAVSNVTKAEIEEQLGSQDLPMIMNNTPSVYATQQGGGAGDARINVRGFNQNNIAIMINGVPVNDMENGWVYWSNWDGIADATASIQMQRGLSAVNLATPSVGGTMNIITSPAEMKAGVVGKFEVGSGNFFKSTITGHSGLINEKFAVSASVVRKVGKGIVDQTWTDAWAYYLGMSYNIAKNHRLEAYVMGAPQRHGQNLYKQNAAAYDSTYAKDIYGDDNRYDYDYSGYNQKEMDSLNAWGVGNLGTVYATDVFQESDRGRLYNENWNNVDESYTGKQSWNQKSPRSRYNSGFINERENFFHKPLANLNWYAQWSKKISMFTTAYYSGGKGGGTGTYGKIQYDYSGPSRVADWNSTIEHNMDPDYSRQGILRNSVNNQYTIGAISKVKVVFNDAFKMQAGIDWRTAKIDHFREVRDLLGLNSYTYTGNQFDTDASMQEKGLGDRIAYNNTNTVDWFGGFLQAEYSNGVWSAYATTGYSAVKYGFTDHFTTSDTLSDGSPDVNSGELTSTADWIGGYQLKGGLNYNISETFNIFGNAGYVTKVPIFDNVIDDSDGSIAPTTENEKFISYELGAGYKSLDNKLSIAANFYYTTWNDRTFTKSVRLTESTTGIAYILGMDQRHTGLEIEATYRPIKFFGVGFIGSFAKWKYLSDVDARIKDDNNNVVFEDHLYTKDLYVGDAPQTQVGLSLSFYPVKGLFVQFVGRYNANHYSEFNPTGRNDEDDKNQVWKSPSYLIVDAHINYKLPLKGRFGVAIFGHVFNMLNNTYIQDAVDNSAYNSFKVTDLDRMLSENTGRSRTTIANPHTGSSAEVFLGMPITFNAGVKLSFF